MARNPKGITLIELLVVMAIIAVTLTFVGPPVSAGLDNLLLTTSGQRVRSAFRLAQSSARNTGQRVFAMHGENDFKFLRTDQVYQTLTLPRGVRVVTTPQTATFIFLESGALIGPDTLELSNARGRSIRFSIDHARGSVKPATEAGASR